MAPEVTQIMSVTRATLAAALLLSTFGCYTQVMLRDASAPTVKDSTRQQVDTVHVRDREVCYWTRDFYGRPYLRCTETYYSRDWYLYNYAPWWDRYDPYSYDYDRCPRYYFYDPSCGCCRYYTERPCYDCPTYSGGSGGAASGGSVSPSPRRGRAPSPPPSSAGQPKVTEDPSVRPGRPESQSPRIQRSREPSPPSSTPDPPSQSPDPALPKTAPPPQTPSQTPDDVQDSDDGVVDDAQLPEAPPSPDRRKKGWR